MSETTRNSFLSGKTKAPRTDIRGAFAVLSVAGPTGDVGLFRYSTVTLLARLRGWSTSVPLSTAMW